MWRGERAHATVSAAGDLDTLDAQMRRSSQAKRRHLRATSTSKPLVRCPFPELTPREVRSHATPLLRALSGVEKHPTSGRQRGYSGHAGRLAGDDVHEETTHAAYRRELHQLNGHSSRRVPQKSYTQPPRSTSRHAAESENRRPEHQRGGPARHHSQRERLSSGKHASDVADVTPRYEVAEKRLGTMRGSPTRAREPDGDRISGSPAKHGRSDGNNFPRSQGQEFSHAHTSDRSYRTNAREPLSPMHHIRSPGQTNDFDEPFAHKAPAYGRRSHISHDMDSHGARTQPHCPDSVRSRSNPKGMHAHARQHDDGSYRSQSHHDVSGTLNSTRYASNASQHQQQHAERPSQSPSTGLQQRRKQALALLKRSTRPRPRAGSTSAPTAAGGNGALDAYGRSTRTRVQLPNSNPVTPQTHHNAYVSSHNAYASSQNACASSHGEHDSAPGFSSAHANTHNAHSRPPIPVRARTYDPHTSNPRSSMADRSSYGQVANSARRGDEFASQTHDPAYRACDTRTFSGDQRSAIRHGDRARPPPQNASAFESSPPRMVNPRRGVNPRGRHQQPPSANRQRTDSHCSRDRGFHRSDSHMSQRACDDHSFRNTEAGHTVHGNRGQRDSRVENAGASAIDVSKFQSLKKVHRETPIQHTPQKNKPCVASPVANSPHANVPMSPAPYKRSAHDPPEYAEVAEPLMPCPYGCGRKFREKALNVHERACKKVFQTKRRAFDSADSRGVVKALSKLNIKPLSKEEQRRLKRAANKSKWRQQSSQLRSALAACKVTTPGGGSGGGGAAASNSYQEAEPIDNGLISCEHCGRSFNETAHERHVKHCRNAKARPTRLVKGSGHAGGVRAQAGRTSAAGKYGRPGGKPPGINSFEPATAADIGGGGHGKRGTRRGGGHKRRSLKNVQSKIRKGW